MKEKRIILELFCFPKTKFRLPLSSRGKGGGPGGGPNIFFAPSLKKLEENAFSM